MSVCIIEISFVFLVLGPISCNAKLKLNMDPEQDTPAYVNPKIDLTMEMESLNVGLTDTQFHTLIQLGDAMNRMQLGAPYRAYRPYNIRKMLAVYFRPSTTITTSQSTAYKGHSREWWQFAITAVLEVDIRRRTRTLNWEYIKEHRERCRVYCEVSLIVFLK